jgi:hypothetical protein
MKPNKSDPAMTAEPTPLSAEERAEEKRPFFKYPDEISGHTAKLVFATIDALTDQVAKLKAEVAGKDTLIRQLQTGFGFTDPKDQAFAAGENHGYKLGTIDLVAITQQRDAAEAERDALTDQVAKLKAEVALRISLSDPDVLAGYKEGRDEHMASIEAERDALKVAAARFMDRVSIDAKMSGPFVMGIKRGSIAGRTVEQDYEAVCAAISPPKEGGDAEGE